MYSNKVRRQYRREVYKLVAEMRRDQKVKPSKVLATLIRVTLRQRSGHYQKKGLRALPEEQQSASQIHFDHMSKIDTQDSEDHAFDHCTHCGDANENCVCDGGTGRDLFF